MPESDARLQLVVADPAHPFGAANLEEFQVIGVWTTPPASVSPYRRDRGEGVGVSAPVIHVTFYLDRRIICNGLFHARFRPHCRR